MALMETLTDNFNDNSFDSGLWTRSNATQVVEQNEQMEISTITAGNYVALDSVSTYDLTSSYAKIKIIDGGDVAESTVSSYEGYPLVLALDGNNALTWLIGYNTIYAIKKVGGSTTNLATAGWNASTYAWLRTREASGTVYFDYSSDGLSWNNFTSELVSNLFSITALIAEVSVGTWQAEANTTTMIVDHFNVYEATATVSPASLTMSAPEVTATYEAVVLASVSPASVTLTAPEVTATGEVALSAGVSPASLTLTAPSVTATYLKDNWVDESIYSNNWDNGSINATDYTYNNGVRLDSSTITLGDIVVTLGDGNYPSSYSTNYTNTVIQSNNYTNETINSTNWTTT